MEVKMNSWNLKKCWLVFIGIWFFLSFFPPLTLRLQGQATEAPRVDSLIAILKDGKLSALGCQDAENALIRIGQPAVEPLIAALKDKRVRWNAIHVLGRVRDARAVEPLIAVLKDENSFHILDVIGDGLDAAQRQASQNLVNELQGGRTGAGDNYQYAPSNSELAHKSVSDKVAEALVNIGQPAVRPLVGALQDKNLSVRSYTASVLGRIKDSSAVEPLIAALKDKETTVRANAASALGEIRDTRAVEPLIEALKDKELTIRGKAADALGEIGDTCAVESLIAALKDKKTTVRAKAASALGEIGDTRAVEPLIEALKDVKDDYLIVCANAAGALGEIGDARAVEPLIVVLQDNAPSTWNPWAESIYEPHAFTSSADALTKIGQPAVKKAVKKLIASLQDENSNVRAKAAYSLGEIKDTCAFEPLIEALKDKKWTVRGNAAYALGKIGDVRAIGPLRVALQDNDSFVRKVAELALGKMGTW
jgi:HEAT repeat protein